MRHLAMSSMLVLLLCSYSAACDAAEDLTKGEWVGTFELGKKLVCMQVQFTREEQSIKLTVHWMLPGTSGSVAQVRLKSSRVRFELPRGTDKLVFDGQLQGDKISGAVRHAAQQGTFQLMRIAQIDPKVYDAYAGAYELEPNRLVFIRRHDLLKRDPPSSVEHSLLYYLEEAGCTGFRFLSPLSETTFGPTPLLPVPVDPVEITFIRSQEGQVTGLLWRERGHPERSAARSKLYREEEVRFQNGDVTLAGRLLVPSTKGPHPAVVVIHGGYAINRNWMQFIVGDVFARHGIAALVYDKRGTGASTGDWHEIGFSALAEDALAGVEFLRRRKDINPTQVGLWGLSEGAFVAPLAASRSEEVAFLIIVSALGRSRAEGGVMWVKEELAKAEASDEETEEAIAFVKLETHFMRTGKGWKKLEAAFEKVRDKKWIWPTRSALLQTPSKNHWIYRHWGRDIDHDPVPVLSKVTCPVLAVWGELDTGFPPGVNKEGVEKGLRAGGNRDYTTKVFPKGGHTLTLSCSRERRDTFPVISKR